MKKKILITIGLVLLVVVAAVGIKIYRTKLKREYLYNVDGEYKPEPFVRMSDSEIDDCYEMLQYYHSGKSVPLDLRERIKAIGEKYNIFT